MPEPKKDAKAGKTDMISAPMDLDVEVGEGTMKEAYVPSDIAAARRTAELERQKALSLKKGGKVRIGSSDGDDKVPGEDTDK
jgi:hypothetical protein